MIKNMNTQHSIRNDFVDEINMKSWKFLIAENTKKARDVQSVWGSWRVSR